MAMGGEAQHWAATPVAARLLSREFEDGCIRFDPETGETLLLTHLASFVLEHWADDPSATATTDALLAQVLAVDDSAADETTAQALLSQALSELQQAGLVSHCAHA